MAGRTPGGKVETFHPEDRPRGKTQNCTSDLETGKLKVQKNLAELPSWDLRNSQDLHTEAETEEAVKSLAEKSRIN